MSRAVLYAPLALERAALRPARAAVTVVRTGMGPAAAAAAAGCHRGGPVLVAGVAGGLAPGVRPGDLVVADTVVIDGRPPGTGHAPGSDAPVAGDVTAVPGAAALADALRRAGLRTHVGPIVSTSRPATGARRQALAGTGALAVDMESAWLAPPDNSPFAVVRAVVDTADRPLVRPGTVWRGLAALRTLRRAAPVLAAWAASLESAAPKTTAAAAATGTTAGGPPADTSNDPRCPGR